MHYIRLLRPPTINTSNPDDPVLSLLLTITTDLGESFLYPEEPIELAVYAYPQLNLTKTGITGPKDVLKTVASPRPVLWEAGMRVLAAKLHIPKAHLHDHPSCVLIRAGEKGPERRLSLSELSDLLPWHSKEDRLGQDGLIADLALEFGPGGVFSAAVRKLTGHHVPHESGFVHLEIEEDIGESIARHIWDAGLLTASLLVDAAHPGIVERGVDIDDLIPSRGGAGDFNVLELGCGVGILGITIASIAPRIASLLGIKSARPYVLLTDLPEAEERARSNISRFKSHTRQVTKPPETEIEYENLDWDEARNSRFGPIVGSRRWDLVVMSDCTYNIDVFPSLVGTLNALHSHNMVVKPEPETKAGFTSRVLMSTKPRHDSEKALFGLLESEGWSYQLRKAIPLPKINDQPDVVEIYLIEKQAGPTQSSLKRKGSNASSADKPSKKSTSTVSQ